MTIQIYHGLHNIQVYNPKLDFGATNILDIKYVLWVLWCLFQRENMCFQGWNRALEKNWRALKNYTFKMQ